MLLRLATFGTLAYAGYRLFQTSERQPRAARPSDLRIAGGPLSDKATLQHSPVLDSPPA